MTFMAGHQALLMSKAVDPLFAQVRLLCDFDGITGLAGETVYDYSSHAHTLTTAGVVNTLGNGKFGSGGLYTNGGGGGDSRVTTPTHSTLAVSGDFTLQFWLNPGLTMLGGNMYFLVGNGATSDIWCYITPGYKLGVHFLGVEKFDMPGTLVGGQWYFVCLTQNAATSTRQVHLDGVLLYEWIGSTGTMGASGFWEMLSAPSVAGSGVGELCFLDDLRLTGALRDPTVVPTSAFPKT